VWKVGRRLANVNRQKKMTYSYGTTPTTLTPDSGSWSSETWTLNTSLTTSTHVYYDATPGAPNHHYPARIAIDYSAGSTANTQVWETATGTNYNGSTLSPYLTITSTGGSGDSTAVYSGPGGSPANMVTFTKVLIDVSSSGGGTTTESVNTGSVTQNMTGGLSFVVDAGSDASETYIIQLDGVQKATISPSGVGPWFLNYTFAEHTAIGYGTWSLIDQSGAIATPLTTTNTSGPPASTTNSRRKVFCNFW